MYKITFEDQPRHNEPDVEFDSIVLSLEQYQMLPELPPDIFNEKCEFHKGEFYEKVRNPKQSFPAIWIYNEDWKLKEEDDMYMSNIVRWVFVCLDIEKDIWIAFTCYDLATWGDAYGSTVGVAYPRHGDVYCLDAKAKEIVNKYFSC